MSCPSRLLLLTAGLLEGIPAHSYPLVFWRESLLTVTRWSSAGNPCSQLPAGLSEVVPE